MFLHVNGIEGLPNDRYDFIFSIDEYTSFVYSYVKSYDYVITVEFFKHDNTFFYNLLDYAFISVDWRLSIDSNIFNLSIYFSGFLVVYGYFVNYKDNLLLFCFR